MFTTLPTSSPYFEGPCALPVFKEWEDNSSPSSEDSTFDEDEDEECKGKELVCTSNYY